MDKEIALVLTPEFMNFAFIPFDMKEGTLGQFNAVVNTWFTTDFIIKKSADSLLTSYFAFTTKNIFDNFKRSLSEQEGRFSRKYIAALRSFIYVISDPHMNKPDDEKALLSVCQLLSHFPGYEPVIVTDNPQRFVDKYRQIVAEESIRPQKDIESLELPYRCLDFEGVNNLLIERYPDICASIKNARIAESREVRAFKISHNIKSDF